MASTVQARCGCILRWPIGNDPIDRPCPIAEGLLNDLKKGQFGAVLGGKRDIDHIRAAKNNLVYPATVQIGDCVLQTEIQKEVSVAKSVGKIVD